MKFGIIYIHIYTCVTHIYVCMYIYQSRRKNEHCFFLIKNGAKGEESFQMQSKIQDFKVMSDI
jgi:hypothetical protein